MKKLLKSAGLVVTLIMAVMYMSSNASAQSSHDCSKYVDKIVSVLNRLTASVNQCQTMEQFSAIDFDNLTGGLGIDEMPDECGSYKLTKGDKDKINAAWDNVIDAMENKFVVFTGGMLTRQQIKSETDPLRMAFKSAINKSVTFNDLTNNLANM